RIGEVSGVGGVHNQPDLRWRRQVGVEGRVDVIRWLRGRVGGRDKRGVVSREGEGGIDFRAVRVDRQRARVFAKKGDVCDESVVWAEVWVGDIEGGNQFSGRGAHESFPAGKDYVSRLVLHVERVGDNAL